MKIYPLILTLLICFSAKKVESMDDKIFNNQKTMTLKLIKFKTTEGYYPCYDQKLVINSDYEFDQETFLCELFRSIDDFGILMEGYLADKCTYFTGNGHWGEIAQNNRIAFGDHYNENNLTYEMDLDDFIRVNNEYHKLYQSKADEIIFRRIGEKVKLEGIWYK